MAQVYLNQGKVESDVGAFITAKEYFLKSLRISKEIGDKQLEAGGCLQFGYFFYRQAQYVRAEEYIKKGLSLSEEIEDIKVQFYSLEMLAVLRMRDGKIQEAVSYFLSAIEKCEKMRSSLCDNDQFKITFSH